MPITFRCRCRRRFRVAETHGGKRGKCPSCGIRLRIPEPFAPESVEAEAHRLLLAGEPPPARIPDDRSRGETKSPVKARKSMPGSGKPFARATEDGWGRKGQEAEPLSTFARVCCMVLTVLMAMMFALMGVVALKEGRREGDAMTVLTGVAMVVGSVWFAMMGLLPDPTDDPPSDD